MIDFKREILGKWSDDPKFKQAYLLWVSYYWQTEDFDRFICGGELHPEFGVALPVWGVERDACNHNAQFITEWVQFKAHTLQIPNDKMKYARKMASVNSHERNEEILLSNGKDPWYESAKFFKFTGQSYGMFR